MGKVSKRTSGGPWKRWTEREAREALEELSRSGATLVEFARSKQVSPQRFTYWRKRLGKTTPPPAFVSVALSPAALLPPVEILAGRVVVRVRDDFDAERVAQLVEALARRLGC